MYWEGPPKIKYLLGGSSEDYNKYVLGGALMYWEGSPKIKYIPGGSSEDQICTGGELRRLNICWGVAPKIKYVLGGTSQD